jgi:hypothetical protein
MVFYYRHVQTATLTSGGQSYNYIQMLLIFSITVLIRYLWQLKTFVHLCQIHALIYTNILLVAKVN